MPRKSAAAEAIPKDESKRDKFIRLGEARVTRAVKSIESIGKLSGGGYEYSEEDTKLLLKELTEAVSGVAFKFHRPAPKFMFLR